MVQHWNFPVGGYKLEIRKTEYQEHKYIRYRTCFTLPSICRVLCLLVHLWRAFKIYCTNSHGLFSKRLFCFIKWKLVGECCNTVDCAVKIHRLNSLAISFFSQLFQNNWTFVFICIILSNICSDDIWDPLNSFKMVIS